jgi:RNA-directed DNA polymerase
MSTVAKKPMYGWNTLRWPKIQRDVFKLQKRIYQASRRGDVKRVRKLQRLLLRSWSARLLAVRRVTQDNRGKKTAGVDGVKSLTPPQRLKLAENLKLEGRAKPVRRSWIPKPGSDEKRPLGIPIMADRARQALVKAALEPEWEARFEANSYGFRPGRSAHDAIKAIYGAISQKAKWVLDADIAKCFDRINHEALLAKINTSPMLRRQIKAWLKAGVMSEGKLFPTEAGTPQGGTISPLLANIALHGLELMIIKRFPRCRVGFHHPLVVRFADDLVILHAEREVIELCWKLVSEWLAEMGLELNPRKTRIAHTLEAVEGVAGFDFLGFQIRQYPAGKTKSARNGQGQRLGMITRIEPSNKAIAQHHAKLKETIRRHRGASQANLIRHLNPQIRGWSRYYAHVITRRAFERMNVALFAMLLAWAKRRHPEKGVGWVARRYWGLKSGSGWKFQTRDGKAQLHRHGETHYQSYVKVAGTRSPYDGDWVYWSARLGRHPNVRPRVARLLKRQHGRCAECGLWFVDGDLWEVDHLIPKGRGGTNAAHNLQLLHRHCHDVKTARETDPSKRYV